MNRPSLRSLFGSDDIVLAPGGGGPLDLLMVERAGYKAAYLSGYSVAAQRYGLPDIGLIAFREMSEVVNAVCRVTSLPIIVDCDTGYGGVLNVRQTVREFEDAGAAAVMIEDQSWPKRCGHMQNKTIEPIEIAVAKIEAAVKARRNDDLVIMARTDACDVLGFEEALRRCKAFKAVGADMVCMHSPRSIEDLKILAAEIEGPHVVSIGEGEFTDAIDVSELFRIGFQFASLPSGILRTAAFAVTAMLERVRERRHARDIAGSAIDLGTLNELVGLAALSDFEDSIGQRPGRAS
ncbi:isocitrate lyase/PEP mutase family protein [Bosea sp. (in: a-proteobacteria)]|uniref:isocitrate lyase/PEP mutase family protein n=1 Tax=Bosea sp. (in: a-proteobacteria) TaxID=1871050 RepID=UPI00262E3F53|nr:isocitrate lyase/PEP mutase family protein [Bosea sp. (in: a-proteobacteria)]MCO5089853.1 isocitrate lyase/PEP mutase family protein [Bosea sp. (in: a-proteobacteria)]